MNMIHILNIFLVLLILITNNTSVYRIRLLKHRNYILNYELPNIFISIEE